MAPPLATALLALLAAAAPAAAAASDTLLQCNLTAVAENRVSLPTPHEYVDAYCDWRGYMKDNLLGAFIVCGLIGIAVCISAPIFFVSREWFKCCGGLRPAPDALCFVKEYALNPATAYSETHIKRSKRAAVYVLVLCIAGVGVTVFGGIDLYVKVVDAKDLAEGASNTLATDTANYATCLADAAAQTPEDQYLDDMKAVLEDVSATQKKFHEYMTDTFDTDILGYLLTAEFGVAILCVATLLTMVVGVVFGYRNIANAGPLVVAGVLFALLCVQIVFVLIDVAVGYTANEFCGVLQESCCDSLETSEFDNVVGAVLRHECAVPPNVPIATAPSGPIADLPSLAAFVAASHELVARSAGIAARACGLFYAAAQTDPLVTFSPAFADRSAVCNDLDKMALAFNSSADIGVQYLGRTVSVDECAVSSACASTSRVALVRASGASGNAQTVAMCNDDHGVPADTPCAREGAARYIPEAQVDNCDGAVFAGKELLAGFLILAVATFAGIFVMAHGSKTFRAPTFGDANAYGGLVGHQDNWQQPLFEEARAGRGDGEGEMHILAVE